MIDKYENIKTFIEYSSGGVLSKDLVRSDKINVTLFCMAQGTEISEHTSIKEGIVYVIEGKGIFNLKGKKIIMIPNILIHLKENAIHSLKVEENTSFILMLFG